MFFSTPLRHCTEVSHPQPLPVPRYNAPQPTSTGLSAAPAVLASPPSARLSGTHLARGFFRDGAADLTRGRGGLGVAAAGTSSASSLVFCTASESAAGVGCSEPASAAAAAGSTSSFAFLRLRGVRLPARKCSGQQVFANERAKGMHEKCTRVIQTNLFASTKQQYKNSGLGSVE